MKKDVHELCQVKYPNVVRQVDPPTKVGIAIIDVAYGPGPIERPKEDVDCRRSYFNFR